MGTHVLIMNNNFEVSEYFYLQLYLIPCVLLLRENGICFHRILQLEGASRSSSCAHWHCTWRNGSPKRWCKWPTVTGPGQHGIRSSVYFLIWVDLCFCLTNPRSPKPIVKASLCVDAEGLADTGSPKSVCFCRIFMLSVCLYLLLLWRSLWDALIKKYRIKGWKGCHPWTHLFISLNAGQIFCGARSGVHSQRK